jgi:uncharacterized protein with GYD domain
MPRYLSLFKYNAEGRKGLMKEKAAAREAALKLTIESAGGKLELIYWAAPGGEYSGINIGEFPDAGSCAAVVGLIEATGMFSEIKVIELLTASEIADGQKPRHETVQLLGRCRCLGLPRLPSRCERARGPLNHSGLRNGYLLGVRRSSNHTSDWVVIQSVAEE